MPRRQPQREDSGQPNLTDRKGATRTQAELIAAPTRQHDVASMTPVVEPPTFRGGHAPYLGTVMLSTLPTCHRSKDTVDSSTRITR